jgi:predicted membrane GTPase involved in stress response
MHPDLPIEQLLRCRDTRFQFGFASEAKRLVPAREEFVLSASNNGLHVLGRNEESLAAPVEVLREVYGPRLEVQPPRVRLIEGVQVQEPIMHVRVSLQVHHREAVKQALAARGATLSEEYARSTYCVLRYQAPLADLLGLPAELDRLTAGAARHWIVLSHYALVTRDPGGRAA